MNQARTVLVPTLLAAAFLAFSSRAENPTYAPASGTSLSKRVEKSSEVAMDDMTMVVNGQEMDAASMGMEMDTSTNELVAVTDTYGEVSDGRPARLKRTFDELSSNTSVSMTGMMGDMDNDMTGSSDLEGLTVVFNWNDEDGAYDVAFAEDSDGDEALLEGLTESLDMREFLPTSEVSEGDTWEVDAQGLRQIFAPGGSVKIQPEELEEMFGMGQQPSADQMIGDLEGEVMAEFKGTLDEGGTRVAVIKIKADVSSANDLTELMEEMMADAPTPEGMDIEFGVNSYDMEFAFEGEGDLLWNLESGLVYGFDISGEVTLTIDSEMDINAGGMEQALEQSLSLSGSQKVTLSTE